MSESVFKRALVAMADRGTSVFPPLEAPVVIPLFGPAPSVAPTPAIVDTRVDQELAAVEAELAIRIDEAFRAGLAEGEAGGRAAGEASGHRRGLAEGEARAQAALAETLRAHEALVDELTAARDAVRLAARSDAIELALRLAERIVAGRLEDGDVLAARLRAALEGVSDGYGAAVRVRVSPSQIEIFRSMRQLSGERELALEFEPDPALRPGDLLVECGGREARAIVSEQLALLEEVLRG